MCVSGALLILDEIPNSLGRTGTFFTFEQFGVVPDMVVIGKGLGGGVWPVAALIATEELNEVCATKALGHYTHEKNPVACAAGPRRQAQLSMPPAHPPSDTKLKTKRNLCDCVWVSKHRVFYWLVIRASDS